MYTECAPSGFKDFGIEWDWLGFFWNLWTYGSYKFSVSEINAVWDGVPNYRAYQCCLPMSTVCYVKTSNNPCPTYPILHVEYQVGKKWNELRDEAANIYGYGSAKYNQFVNRGYNARVDYFTP